MRIWVPIALGGMILVAYALVYAVGVSEAQGATSIGIANAVGLVAVFVGLVAAALILRRAAPHQ